MGGHQYNRCGGFTLIELSIVLVIIGLIVGGILTGQSLIGASAVRAQITQLEKYNTAANAFHGKYGYLPGDIPAAPAAQFGFAPRGAYAGEGDGNGVIQGVSANAANANSAYVGTGEAPMFWVDLSAAKLIDGGFTTASSTVTPGGNISQTGVSNYMPQAKVGRGNYLFVFSGFYAQGSSLWMVNNNYFCLAGMTGITPGGVPMSSPALSVNEAYSIDKKIDDGMPMQGKVTAFYFTNNANALQDAYPAGGGSNGTTPSGPYASYGGGTVGSSTTCYDNGGSGGPSNPFYYSISQNGGAGVNCALSIRMQAGD